MCIGTSLNDSIVGRGLDPSAFVATAHLWKTHLQGPGRYAASSFCRKDFANKITPTQVQIFCGWVGAFLFIEGEIICFVVFILWFML